MQLISLSTLFFLVPDSVRKFTTSPPTKIIQQNEYITLKSKIDHTKTTRRSSRNKLDEQVLKVNTEEHCENIENDNSLSKSKRSLTPEDKIKCNTLPRLYVGSKGSTVSNIELSPILFKGAKVILSSAQTHYLIKVMRFFKNKKRFLDLTSKNTLTVSGEDNNLAECVRLFDGVNGEWLAKVIAPTIIEKSNQRTKNLRKAMASEMTTLKAECLTQLQCQNSKNLSQTWIIFAPIKKQRLKLLVEKCTELGADVFCPVLTDHCNTAEELGDKEMEKLSLVAREAAEQCERLSIPKMISSIDIDPFMINDHDYSHRNGYEEEEYLELKELLDVFISSTSHCNSALFVCRERKEQTIPILETFPITLRKKYERSLILVGPEGGWSERENDLLDDFAFKFPEKIFGVSLGTSVLRAETAAISALAAHTLWTDTL